MVILGKQLKSYRSTYINVNSFYQLEYFSLTGEEHLAILLMLVKNLKEPPLRCGAIKVLSQSLAETSLLPATRDNLQLCSEVFAGLASSLRNTESDGFTEITLIELGLSSSVELRDLRVYEDFRIVLPVVDLVQNKSTSVKLHIAQTVRMMVVTHDVKIFYE